MFFCVAAHIVTFVATERCQPPTIARKMICGSPCPALTHHPPGNVCYCFVLGPWVCGDAQTFHVRLWPRPVLACVCVHTQTFGTSQHIKLSKSTKHFKGGHDLLLFFGVWPNMKMRVACLFGCSLEPWVWVFPSTERDELFICIGVYIHAHIVVMPTKVK